MTPAVLFAVVLAAASTGGDDARAALSKASDSSIQTRLPGETATEGSARATARRARLGGDPASSRARARERSSIAVPDAARGVGSVILWALVIAAIGLLAVYLARELLAGRGDAAVLPPPPEPSIDASVTERPLADAEALAGAGRYREAIHALLLGTLRELADRTGIGKSRSLTSREIVARVAVTSPARAALGDLVTAVEITHFGDTVPGASEYAACRRQFDVVVRALPR
jgi:hypothetical protein